MPSLVPDHDTYIVLDDFGPLGMAWRETDEAATGRAAVIRNILDGQYESPVRIDEVRRRFVRYDEAPVSILRFLDANRH